jgi:hypothetical protein
VIYRANLGNSQYLLVQIVKADEYVDESTDATTLHRQDKIEEKEVKYKENESIDKLIIEEFDIDQMVNGKYYKLAQNDKLTYTAVLMTISRVSY